MRRRRFGEVVRLEVERDMTRACESGSSTRCRSRRARCTRPRAARDGRPLGHRRGPGLRRAALPAVLRRHPAASAGRGRQGGRRDGRDARGRHPRPPPLRLVRDLGRALRPPGRPRPRRAGDQADRVPDEPGLDPGPVADRGLGARQAGGLHGGAESALRRAGEHPLGEEAGGGGRARRLRDPGAQDALQVHSRRAPRGRPRAQLRPHRDRQLQPEDGAPLHRPRPVHAPTPTSAPTWPRCSTT